MVFMFVVMKSKAFRVEVQQHHLLVKIKTADENSDYHFFAL